MKLILLLPRLSAVFLFALLFFLNQILWANEIQDGIRYLEFAQSPLRITYSALPEVKLERPLALTNPMLVWPDMDKDGLDDEMEDALAEQVRPLLVFDLNENALEENGPLALFQLRPLDLSDAKNLTIKLRWILLFEKNGGYWPCSSFCDSSHAGDIKVITYEMHSKDGGGTWEAVTIALGEKNTPVWKKGCDMTYWSNSPLIFISSGRHNPYFTTYPKGVSSPYSTFGCCDMVNGRGRALLPETKKNIGEPESHPEPYFTNSLAPQFHDYSVWSEAPFFSQKAGVIKKKLLDNEMIPYDATLCSLESLAKPTLFVRHKRFAGEITEISSARDRLDARFRLMREKGGEGIVMIESVNYPGYFLAQKNGLTVLLKPDREEIKMAALFRIKKGLANKKYVSFESASEPGKYLSEKDGRLTVESGRGKPFRKQATFIIRPLR